MATMAYWTCVVSRKCFPFNAVRMIFKVFTLISDCVSQIASHFNQFIYETFYFKKVATFDLTIKQIIINYPFGYIN